MNNTLIVGWDGAPFVQVEKWIDEGHLPNLAEIRDDGYFGPLETVSYIMSPCAWSTFLTAKNAGKHGIYDFYGDEFRDGQYFREPINATARVEPELWQILNQQGYAAGVINVPITYPAEELDGHMVSGVLAPDVYDESFAYPGDLLESFDRLDEYLIDLDVSKDDDKNVFIDRVHEMVERRTDLILHCIENGKPVDLLLAVFTSPDRLAHYYWHFEDETHPYRETESAETLEEYRHAMRELFELLDEKLGIIVDRYAEIHGERANVTVLSDHGMDSLKTLFLVNQWLAEEGYLVFDEDKGVDAEELPEEKEYIFGKVDWEQTQAYSIGKAGEIYINLEGREPEGSVSPEEYDEVREEIAEKLRLLTDPKTGEEVLGAVTPREELFDGPHVDSAPDLFVSMDDGYYSLGYFFEENVFLTNNRSDAPFVTGIEDGAGILCQAGPDFSQHDQRVDIGLGDYLPTLLYALGLDVPDDVDGHVVKELATNSERDVSTRRFTDEIAGESDGISESAKERLEDLGYR